MKTIRSLKDAINEAKKMKEQSDEKSEYDVFFEKKLKEWGVKSPEDLSEEEKKRFFDEVDAEWKADDEEEEMNEAMKLQQNLRKW